MADVNVSVVTIDSGMDCFEKIQDAVTNYQKVALYDIKQLGDAILLKIQQLQSELSSLYGQLSNARDEDEEEAIRAQIRVVQEKLERMNTLRRKHSMVQKTYKEHSQALVSNINEKVNTGVRDMAVYLRHISGIDDGGGSGARNGVNMYSGESNYAVVIIDSNKYPETAEHIRVAVREGHPAMLTLDRTMADENRKLSLAGIPERSYADRDEYPPASFSEGGEGAHVAYIDSSDNRGSGSSFRWQLDGVPDGTRVRFRVI